MRESQLANRIRTEGRSEGRTETTATNTVQLLRHKFGDDLTSEIVQTITDQDDFTLLNDWFRAAIEATTLDDFLAVMRHG